MGARNPMLCPIYDVRRSSSTRLRRITGYSLTWVDFPRFTRRFMRDVTTHAKARALLGTGRVVVHIGLLSFPPFFLVAMFMGRATPVLFLFSASGDPGVLRGHRRQPPRGYVWLVVGGAWCVVCEGVRGAWVVRGLDEKITWRYGKKKTTKKTKKKLRDIIGRDRSLPHSQLHATCHAPVWYVHALCPCVSGADWCLQSDAVPDSGCQGMDWIVDDIVSRIYLME